MNLFTVPAHVPFLDAIATEWLGRAADPMQAARGLILLPTRRAARSLAEAFLRAAGGRALLMPRITAIGALDEAQLALSGALELPPEVEPMQRLAALTRLILAMGGKDGAPRTADRAWRLAEELALLMDEAERAEIDLAHALPDAADPSFARHWAQTLSFLRIVTSAWPDHLAEQGLMNPAARQVALLDAQAAAWEQSPPTDRILLAGMTGGIPAIARLARTIARLPNGAVVLAGLNLDLPEPVWEVLEETHYQAGLRALLRGLGATRDEVRLWPALPASEVPPERVTLMRRVLLPGAALAEWQAPGTAVVGGLSRLETADQQEEAAAIALVLREALEQPGARAALVTPDRELAVRVSAELLRFGVVADDSAGEKLADTPPAVFLRLLVRAVAEELAPVPLLALLKHPLAGAGLAPPACRAGARLLERACLRGPRPAPGLAGLRRVLDASRSAQREEAIGFLACVEAALAPALRFAATLAAPPAEALAAMIEAAENLASTDEASGEARLWAGEEGEALAERLSAALAALPVLPDQAREVLPGLLDALLADAAVRTRRALRGRDGAEHPRIAIWGLLEARLQQADLLVLGGLVEGVWPPAADPGPWLSRPMRASVGLASPEERVGQSAHDFASLVCAAPQVVLSSPGRREGAPSVPSRWLTRLEMYISGRGQALPVHPASRWVHTLDQPDGPPRPARPPAPRPPLARRPNRLSVTEIETWLRDPYAIYAKHVLKLVKLKPLDEATDAADYGSLVHAALHRFLGEHSARWPDDAKELLRRAFARTLAEAGLREALATWWAPRLERIADWVAAEEPRRRAEAPIVELWSEVTGSWHLLRPQRRFTLTGRADRIERYADGRLGIIDYKTGAPPTPKDIEQGLAPQLPLEAAMAAAGAFGPERTGETAALCYWRVTGGFVPGEARPLFGKDPGKLGAIIADAAENLAALIDAFDDPARAYLSRPHPARAPRFSDYVQLARVAEWAAAEGE